MDHHMTVPADKHAFFSLFTEILNPSPPSVGQFEFLISRHHVVEMQRPQALVKAADLARPSAFFFQDDGIFSVIEHLGLICFFSARFVAVVRDRR